MKHVELVRQRITSGLHGELTRLRIWVSATDGNEAAVERLREQALSLILAQLTETLMEHMGHATAVNADRTESKARRAAAKLA